MTPPSISPRDNRSDSAPSPSSTSHGSLSPHTTLSPRALESNSPRSSSSPRSDHTFEKTYFTKPTWCWHCKEFLWGVHKKQGYACTLCGFAAHDNCRSAIPAGTCGGVSDAKGWSLSPRSPRDGQEKCFPHKLVPVDVWVMIFLRLPPHDALSFSLATYWLHSLYDTNDAIRKRIEQSRIKLSNRPGMHYERDFRVVSCNLRFDSSSHCNVGIKNFVFVENALPPSREVHFRLLKYSSGPESSYFNFTLYSPKMANTGGSNFADAGFLVYILGNEVWKFFAGNSEKYRLEEGDIVSFKLGKVRKTTWDAMEQKYPRENFTEKQTHVFGIGLGNEKYSPKYLTAFCSKRAERRPGMTKEFERFLMTPEEEEMMRGQTPNFEISESEKSDWHLYLLLFQNGKMTLPPMIFKEFVGPVWLGFRFAGRGHERIELITDRKECPKLSSWFTKETKEKQHHHST